MRSDSADIWLFSDVKKPQQPSTGNENFSGVIV